ncbi:MAG: hypothetical protein ACR2QW_16945, partial [bacterium]
MNQKNVATLNSGAPNQHTVIHVHTTTLKLFVALLPLVGCTAIVWLRHTHYNKFKYLFIEDHLFEYLTSIFYFCAAAIAIFIALTFKREERFVLAAAYYFLTLGLFFVAGEEISWGQRILNIETPLAIIEINSQKELTIHNLKPIQHMLHAIY